MRTTLLRDSAAVALLAAAGTWTVFAAQRPDGQQHVLATVTENDKPVVNLSMRDFVVRENGVAREVLGVTPAPPPAEIVLLVDDSAASLHIVTELRQALTLFVRQTSALDPPPAIGLVTFGDRPTNVLGATPNPIVVGLAIDRIFSRPNAGARLLDAIVETCTALKKRAAVDPVIVAFTVEDAAEFSTADRSEVRTSLRNTGATLWSVVLRPQPGAGADLSDEAKERAAVLGEVGPESGGAEVTALSAQGLDRAAAHVVELMMGRYDVVYSRPQSFLPPTKLEVTAKGRRVNIAAPGTTR